MKNLYFKYFPMNENILLKIIIKGVYPRKIQKNILNIYSLSLLNVLIG